MTRKRLVQQSITFAISWTIVNLVGGYVWPMPGVNPWTRVLTSLIVIAAITALLYRWTSPQERPPDVDEPREK